MRHAGAATCVIVVLAACGGSSEEPVRQSRLLRQGPVTIESVFGPPSPVMPGAARRAADAASQTGPTPAAELAAATAEHPQLAIEDEQGRSRTMFELRAAHGKGFPELTVVVRARRIGDTAPPAPLRPTCKAADRCEYTLGRTYVLTLSKGTALQLVPRGEAVALVARQLSVTAPDATEVRLTGENRLLGRGSVALLPGAP